MQGPPIDCLGSSPFVRCRCYWHLKEERHAERSAILLRAAQGADLSKDPATMPAKATETDKQAWQAALRELSAEKSRRSGASAAPLSAAEEAQKQAALDQWVARAKAKIKAAPAPDPSGGLSIDEIRAALGALGLGSITDAEIDELHDLI